MAVTVLLAGYAPKSPPPGLTRNSRGRASQPAALPKAHHRNRPVIAAAVPPSRLRFEKSPPRNNYGRTRLKRSADSKVHHLINNNRGWNKKSVKAHSAPRGPAAFLSHPYLPLRITALVKALWAKRTTLDLESTKYPKVSRSLLGEKLGGKLYNSPA